MNSKQIENSIEETFRKKVRKDSQVRNAYLSVHSDKLGVHCTFAEGSSKEASLHPQQPNYMASVGKLFTSTVIGLLVEEGKISYEDKIAEYIDGDLMEGLHVYRGTDYSQEIEIRHCLAQTSGLNDAFWPLLEKLLENPDQFDMEPKEAIQWLKRQEGLKPYGPPGREFHYTDTNYYLLGLLAESVSGAPYHEMLHNRIFNPLGMKHSYMLHRSRPMEEPPHPMAKFYLHDTDVSDYKGYYGIDYAGGGVVAPAGDLLTFMQSLVEGEIVTKETLEKMKKERGKMGLGITYGYGIWSIKTVPILFPKKYNSWGCYGATGAFLFYHPGTEAYIIGNFNQAKYKRSGVRFMLKVINKLLK